MDYETTPEEVKGKLESGADFTLLDCREPWEYQTARIESALNIPVSEIPPRLRELDRDKHIVVMCHHGVRSMNVTGWLRQQGFKNVQSMAGGIDAWSRRIDPKVPIY